MQNQYNIVHREDDALIDELAANGVAYVPFFPLGGFSPLQSSDLNDVAASLGATPMQVALAWLLKRAPNILLIPGTSSRAHLRENLAAAELAISGGRGGEARRDRPARLEQAAFLIASSTRDRPLHRPSAGSPPRAFARRRMAPPPFRNRVEAILPGGRQAERHLPVRTSRPRSTV